MRKALLLLLTLLTAAPLLADEIKPLSRSERKERTAKLSESYRQFLADVEPIASTAERDTFLRLETDPQRDVFIEDFWRRRDIARGTTGHAMRDDYYERLEYVREKFDGVMSDRGRVYLLHGVPGALIDINCPRYFVPIQVWYYPYIEGLGLGRAPALLPAPQRPHVPPLESSPGRHEGVDGATTSSRRGALRRTSRSTAATARSSPAPSLT